MMTRVPRGGTACVTSGVDEIRLALSPDGKCFDNWFRFTGVFLDGCLAVVDSVEV